MLPSAESLSRVAWITDPHLNFCENTDAFWSSVSEKQPDAVLLGGDLTEASDLERTFSEVEAKVALPIFFVLGNHDFYHGSIEAVEELAARFHAATGRLTWLPEVDYVPLSEKTALVGHGGWADGRYGDYQGSGVRLNDHRLIAEFKGRDAAERLELMQELAARSANHFRRALPQALDRFKRVIVLTHVPPFQEAAWHEGRAADRFYLPHFACKAVGDVIRSQAEERTDREILVLCGHTHGQGAVQVLPNLKVVTGGAIYGRPKAQAVFEVDEEFERIP